MYNAPGVYTSGLDMFHRTHTIPQPTHTILLQTSIPGYRSSTWASAGFMRTFVILKSPGGTAGSLATTGGRLAQPPPMIQSLPWLNRQCVKYTHFMCQARKRSKPSIQTHRNRVSEPQTELYEREFRHAPKVEVWGGFRWR